MEKALIVINEMERESVIERYAIGGAIAATRYIEPIQTYDLDIFVLLSGSSTGLISVSPIYTWLTSRGHTPQRDLCEKKAARTLPAS